MRLASFLFFIACRTEKPISEPSDDGAVVLDEDGDGYTTQEDCDDSDSSVHPGAVEVCDSLDNNCDGLVDEEVTIDFYLDNDGDGFGDERDVVQACEIPAGYSFNGTDCDDEEPASFPGNPEVCDGIDNDCNELTDDEDANLDLNTATPLYIDNDGDGFGDAGTLVLACSESEGQVINGEDCNDEDGNIHPDAQEVCDGIDNDCDALLDLDDDSIDENSGGTFYADNDGDGFGDAASLVVTCDAPMGYVETFDDCNDEDGNIHPDAQEVCDGIDNDCDTQIDDDDASLDATTGTVYYLDTDHDGFGSAQTPVSFCENPGYGYSSDDTDCEDTEDYTYPGAAFQEGQDCLSDFDGDGYAPISQGGMDCDDTNPAILPTNTDIVGDLIDQNCDGIDGTDMDGDGFASQASGGEDCDDGDPSLTDNCPPQWGSVEISGDPYSTEELSCVANATDPDGDSLSYSYAWMEGVSNIGTAQTLAGGILDVGDTVQCCVIASDGALSTAELCSDSLEIENQLPVVAGYVLSESSIYTHDTLSVAVTLSDMDASQQSSLMTVYEWHVVDAHTGTDTIVQSGPNSSLDGNIYFDRDDEVYVVLTPNDGVDDGLAVTSSSIVVLNTSPTAPTISISPSAATQGEDDLTCTIDVESQDDDGDAVLYTYTWTDPSGVIQQTTTDTTSLTDVFLAAGTEEGTWTCTVAPTDESAIGSSGEAVAVVTSPVECSSIQFTSVNASITVPNTGFGVGSGAWTFEYWVKMDDVFSGGNYFFVQNENYSSNAFRSPYNENTGIARCYTYRNTSGSHNLDHGYSAPINDGNWHHIACSYSGGTLEVYTDGVLTTTDSGAPTLYEQSNMSIGNASGYSGYFAPSATLGPIRISGVDRYTSDFTPAFDWVVDSDTIAQYLTTEPFDGSSLIDEAGGDNTGIHRQDVVSVDSCPGSDEDGDGVAAWEDCDDGDASISSLAVEVCDGVDNNCDGEIDENCTFLWQDLGQEAVDVIVGCCHHNESKSQTCSSSTVGNTIYIGGPTDITPNSGTATELKDNQGIAATLSNNDSTLSWSGGTGCGCDRAETHTMTVYECISQ